MDPLSISMACVTLADLMFKVSRVTSSFLRGIRTAETDVNEITAEFDSISATMKLLTKEFLEKTPENIRGKISDVVASCSKIIEEIHRLLSYYSPPLCTRRIRWVISGKKSLETLKNSLNTHRLTLGMALDIANLYVRPPLNSVRYVRLCRANITDVKDSINDIQGNAIGIKNDVAHILNKVRLINWRISDKGKDLMLRSWLADTSSYSGTTFTSAGLDTAVLRQRYGVPPKLSLRCTKIGVRTGAPLVMHSTTIVDYETP
ncbi:hypothetical protein K445DRAFT_21420 [Daldinia sp. EC12]|nr:hypothetical protein K445DRAFT_21420 [Daldinia sp. EC12]